jgi:lipopolysaccharide export system protein LptA
MRQTTSIWLVLMLSLLTTGLLAQVVEPSDSSAQQIVNIDNANELRLLNRGAVQRLIGEVELSQDSIFMYCDSAELVSEVQVYAYENVIIQQGDSLAAFANYLDYNAETLLALLEGNVVLKRGDTELYTERLDYDLKTKLATYHTGGRIVNKETELSSRHGYYYADDDMVFFRDSVVVIDDRFEMRADTLRYDLANERVYFLGPTVIRTDTNRIYCESGYYDVALERAVFSENAQYQSGQRLAAADTIRYFGPEELYILEGRAFVAEGEFQRATADRISYFGAEDRYKLEGQATVVDSNRTVTGDTINYNAEAGSYAVAGGRPRVSSPPNIILADRMDYDPDLELSIATGNVIFRDTSADLTIEAENARYNEASGYVKAYGGRDDRPLLTALLDLDTMWMAADTLLSLQSDSVDANGDTIRYLSAYHDVRILKSDLQAVCDSLGFNTVDSILTLYDDPILWQDTSQLIGDTISVFFRGESPDKVRLQRNAMVITTPDLIFFNQVKGKIVEAFFDSTSLSRTEVNGNAEAIYYVIDEEGAYVGVNKTACSSMVLEFSEGAVTRIRFLSAPSGKMQPMQDVDHEAFKLEGFRWEIDRQPKTLDDLFGGRPVIVTQPGSEPAGPPEIQNE